MPGRGGGGHGGGLHGGAHFAVPAGHTPAMIAQHFGVHPSRWPELVHANPFKPNHIIHGHRTFRHLHEGEFLVIPASWWLVPGLLLVTSACTDWEILLPEQMPSLIAVQADKVRASGLVGTVYVMDPTTSALYAITEGIVQVCVG